MTAMVVTKHRILVIVIYLFSALQIMKCGVFLQKNIKNILTLTLVVRVKFYTEDVATKQVKKQTKKERKKKNERTKNWCRGNNTCT